MRDIEKLFYEEVRDKKKTASGAFHMTGHGVKNGIRGGMKTPVDYLKGKDKKEYIKGGIILEYNVYDKLENLPKLNELKAMDYEKARNILIKAKENFSSKEIFKQLGTSNGTLYGLYDKYNIQYNKRGSKFTNNDLINKVDYKFDSEYDKYKDINNVPKLKEIEAMKYEEAKKLMHFIRINHTMPVLRKYWGKSGNYIYNVFDKYDVPKSNKGGNMKEKSNKLNHSEVVQVNPVSQYEQENMIDKYTEKFNAYSTALTQYASELEKKLAVLQAENNRLTEYQGFKINLGGKFTQADLDKRISAIQLQLIDGKEYNVKIVVEEII